ncbi:hypothetical protein EDB81DRAFT_691194 [Dactylonectria macrodidyma]|uniref:Zn(2)-C6 fungal-type domain-containing protein n=1 Tax=Dactylonectria macrodidyma TaxID=307937 RepID=A0A9P9EQ12_9HYPO|nr:hypothetical protein EDB81DRAFT_691194 [Dactylonectria macrodidyma]
MRPPSACGACRARRKKCRRPREGSGCYFCIKRGMNCRPEENPSQRNSAGYDLLQENPDGGPLRISLSVFMDEALSCELVGLYFRYVHVAFHNIFHQPSFEKDVRDRVIPKILFLGVISLSARFSSHSSFADIQPSERGRNYAKEAEKLIDLHNISLTTIQACMLMSAVYAVEGKMGDESIFLNIACRMAMLLDLPNAVARTRIEKEVNLRVWWSLIATDTWSSTALRLPRAIHVREGTRMPMDELSFLQLTSDELTQLDQPTSLALSPTPESAGSLFAQMIQLNQLLYRIITLSTEIVSGSIQGDEMEECTEVIRSSFDAWLAALPAEMRYTPENLSFWASKNCGQKFVILHINHNYAGQLLFYRFLNSCREDFDDGSATDPAHQYARRCKAHANGLCELIYHAMETPETDVMYPLLGHVLVITSTVQLFTLLFSPDDAEIARAKYCLERNFGIILRLQKHWPTLDASFGKFKAFHDVCLKQKQSAFLLDWWMLRFMLEFAQPINGREEEVVHENEHEWSLGYLGY